MIKKKFTFSHRDKGVHCLRGCHIVELHLLLQDVEGLPSGAGGTASSIRDVKRAKKGEVSWLMATTYLTRWVPFQHVAGAIQPHVGIARLHQQRPKPRHPLNPRQAPMDAWSAVEQPLSLSQNFSDSPMWWMPGCTQQRPNSRKHDCQWPVACVLVGGGCYATAVCLKTGQCVSAKQTEPNRVCVLLLC